MVEDIKGKRIVLVGGAGFIGHNLALKLKERGAEVSIIDSLGINNLLYLNQSSIKMPNKDAYKKFIRERLELLEKFEIPLIVEDARDYHKLSDALSELKPEVVVLLAAVSHANRSNKDPFSTFDHSFRTLENTLDFSKENVEHFIYFSSSMVYGNFVEDVATEESVCNPIGIYGSLKYSGELLVKAYNQVFDLPYTIIRPSALYGERCVSKRVGQAFIENAMAGRNLSIMGDGSDRLDFTYIGDLVNGVIKVIENSNAKNETFNITYGSSRSLLDLAHIIQDHFDNIDIVFKEKERLMPERGTLSVEKAKKMIGYNPQYPVEKGYVEYINWYKENYESQLK